MARRYWMLLLGRPREHEPPGNGGAPAGCLAIIVIVFALAAIAAYIVR